MYHRNSDVIIASFFWGGGGSLLRRPLLNVVCPTQLWTPDSPAIHSNSLFTVKCSDIETFNIVTNLI